MHPSQVGGKRCYTGFAVLGCWAVESFTGWRATSLWQLKRLLSLLLSNDRNKDGVRGIVAMH